MAKKKHKTDQPDTLSPAATPEPASLVYVTYMGLAPSETQVKALTDRKAGLAASLVNGWVQNKLAPTGPLTLRDVSTRTVRGRAAVEAANEKAQAHVDAYATQTLPPLVLGRKPDRVVIRGGVSALTQTEWSAVKSHPVIVKIKAVETGRIVDPDKTEDLASTKDQNALVALVNRTHCPRGLAWIHGREVARRSTPVGGKPTPNPRARIMAACQAKARKMGIELQG